MQNRSGNITLLKALSDPTRMKIVDVLLKGERCACEIPDLVGKAQPTVSLQLKKLVRSGALSCRKEGTKSIYRIHDGRIAKLLELLG